MAGIVCRLLLSFCGEEGCGDVEMKGIYLSDEEADPVGLPLLLLHIIL